MTDAVSTSGLDLKTADKALNASTQIWFLTMLIGQWIFVYYIVAYYGGKVVKAGLPGFAETHLPGGYIPG
ncbi:hypothetical protein JYU02_01365, partial [bacterium AH-315-P15]|nr:hypothetical protein [bacterium AH-315-P15]